MLSPTAIYAWLGITPTISASLDLVTSPFFSPFTLGLTRLIIGLYALSTACVSLAHDSITSSKHDARGYFSYFTDLSYIGVVAYYIAAAVQTLAFSRNLQRGVEGYPLQRWPRFLQFLHRLLGSTITTFPIIVTVVYWSLLSSSSTFATTLSSWSNISQHALNTVFALFDILFTHAGPHPWTHLPFLIIILALYLAVAYITHATEGFYTYSFLDPKKEHGFLAVYIVGIAVGEVIVFAIVYGICYLRERIATRVGRGVQSEEGEGGGEVEMGMRMQRIDEWEDIEREEVGVGVEPKNVS